MNRQEAKKLLPIIKAYSEGAIIQYQPKGHSNWYSAGEGELDFTQPASQYRIKPDPQGLWVLE